MLNIPKNTQESKRGEAKSAIPPNCVYSKGNTQQSHAQKTASNQHGRKIRNTTKKPPKYSCRALRDRAGETLAGEQGIKGTNGKKDYRVCFCGRRLIPPDESKDRREMAIVYEHIETQHRVIGGTMKCGSVWICADCARKITDGRREEIEKGILEADRLGYQVLMITFTHSHKITDSLKQLLDASAKAKRDCKSGRKYKELKKLYKIVGSIVAHEITYGDINGWHPHYHELLIIKEKLTDEELSELEGMLREIWLREAEKQGLTMNEHGFHLTATRGKIQDYLAKWGREPEDPSKIWGVSEEMVKGQMKQARRIEGLTPFGMLALIKYLDELDEKTEESKKTQLHYEKLFREYADATLGRHQVRWSRGLKKLLGVKQVTDEELANEYIENCIPIAGLLPPAFLIAVENNLLEAILKIDMVDMKLLLCSLGASPKDILLYRAEDAIRWKEHEPEESYVPEPSPEIEEIRYSPKPTEAETELLERLEPYRVIFDSEPCQKCGSHLKRHVLGDIECCKCVPSPLWSNATIKRLKLISLDRKRAKLRSARRERQA